MNLVRGFTHLRDRLSADRAAVTFTVAALAFVLLALGFHVAQADARRAATSSESRALWKVVDPAGRCVHRRGIVSTMKTPPRSYAMVTISDNKCGNGSFILKRLGPKKPWRIVTAGSDWGDPSRCVDDLRKMPLAVLRDLTFKGICTD